MFGGRSPFSQGSQTPQPPPRQQGPPGGYGEGPTYSSGGGWQAAPPPGYNQTPPPRPVQRVPVPGQRASAHSQAPGGKFKVAKCSKESNDPFIFTNLVAVSSEDFEREQYVIFKEKYVLTVRPVPEFAQGCAGFSSAQRDWAQLSLTDSIKIDPYDPFSQGKQAYLGSLDVEVGFATKRITEKAYTQEELSKAFIKNFENQIFAPEQRLLMDFRNVRLHITVKTVEIVDLSLMEKKRESLPTDKAEDRGILTPHTIITFYKDAKSPIKIQASTKRPAANSIIQPNFKFEDMGIGGLDNEFSAIFRRAFASRIFPPGLVEKLGIQHVKGILLFGPPGTGKTLIARQIGKMLNAREPKVVNGPEILNKFVGQSEENIRKLFADAEKEYKEKGEESGLHIIIFDELDAICKQRGSKNDGTGVGDSVVNQLLSKMDGVDQLNNILIIGMTNRLDMIDEALLRPGRLEVHMEISLPDESGRRQIIKIHTNKMRTNNAMDSDVDIEELASLTKNFSGAEISGLVKSATSFAFNRHVKVGTVAGISEDIENLKVNRQDFLNALEEVRPAFGVSEEELDVCLQGGIIRYSDNISAILQEGNLFVQQVRNSEKTHLVTVLMYGPPGSGKTALAAQIALSSEFPFIKLVSPENMVGFNEMSKVSYLTKVFSDAYKSPINIVILDNIERILDWVPIGPRFSNAVLQAILVLLRKQPPKGRRLLIIGTTTERSVLQQLGLLNNFDAEIPVPNVANHHELAHILQEVKLFPDSNTQLRVLEELSQATGTRGLNVGIKKILMSIETARQDEDSRGRFVNVMARAVQEMNMDIRGAGGNDE
ncbi:P-loop containing nucleoside triphosphate hydrolase protein [Kalaharituber pfeilii]|nr:P-loop containing nucleoside triphosphate hydrolase protein [Kalaharituber pfeilii]